ncbi:MAG: TonB-dependent receptor, partial [Acidobacteriaceae bacterium]|nr:TonB-dependent receptor [Acidobacteriaceae bacterium]
MEVSKLFRVVAIAVMAGLSAGLVFAQGTDLGTIRGNVTDVSGAVIPNARVVVTDLATNSTRETKTNGAGDYEVFGVNAGRYSVTVSSAGLETVEITNLAINGSETVTADAKLQVSKTQQSVVVEAENAPIHTEDQTISSSLNNQAVIELPRDSRDIYQFLYLNPNITQADEPGTFKFLGFQSYGGSFSLDGQRSNGGIFGQPTSSEPSLEAVGELNILSNDFSAEYAGIATIRVTTKRGTDQYHGSLFYNNRNSALAAWPLQDKIAAASFAPTPFQSKYPAPFFNLNDVGASFGGPVPALRKNTWFFAAYEHNSTVEPDTVESNNLPHPSLLQGNFSLVDDSIKPAVPASITLTPQEIATDTVGGSGQQFIQIPQRLLNPLVQNLIAKYFTPIGLSAPIDPTTGRVPGFVNLVSASAFQDLGTLRLDHDFSERDHVFVTYNTSALSSSGTPAEDNSPNTGFVGQPYTGLGLLGTDRRNHAVAASYTRVIRPNIVNELRGGFNMEDRFLHSNTTLGGFLSSIGFSQDEINAYGAIVGPAELNTHGQPAISFGGTFATFPNGGRSTDRPENQKLQTFGDTFNWVIGTHNLKMGADFVRNEAVDGFVENRGNVRGLMTYSGSGTTPLADWLMGLPPKSVSYVGSVRPPLNVHNWETGYFFEDDWKVTSHFTLNLGVRYELITPFIEANDLLANFDPNLNDPVTGQPGVFVIPSNRTLSYLDPRIVNYGYVLASQAGVGRGLVNPDTNNIAPRIGFAWRIGEKNVLRGGWGVYYPTSAAQGIRDPMASAPFNPGVTYRATATAPLGGWPGNPEGGTLLSGGVIRGAGNVPTANAVPFHLQQPRIQQYNITFERDLGWSTALRVSYLGTAMHGLIAGKDLDEIPPSNNPFGTTVGDGVTPCDPYNLGNCALSPQDLARLPLPGLQEYVLSYGNFGHGLMNAFQT